MCLNQSQAYHKRQIAAVEMDLVPMVERTMKSKHPTVIGVYEVRLAKLERDKARIIENLSKRRGTKQSFEEIREISLKFHSSPMKNMGK